MAQSQKGTYLVFFLFQSEIHTGDLSLRSHVDLDQRVRSPPFSSVTDGTHALPMTLKLFYFLKTNELKIEVH